MNMDPGASQFASASQTGGQESLLNDWIRSLKDKRGTELPKIIIHEGNYNITLGNDATLVANNPDEAQRLVGNFDAMLNSVGIEFTSEGNKRTLSHEKGTAFAQRMRMLATGEPSIAQLQSFHTQLTAYFKSAEGQALFPGASVVPFRDGSPIMRIVGGTKIEALREALTKPRLLLKTSTQDGALDIDIGGTSDIAGKISKFTGSIAIPATVAAVSDAAASTPANAATEQSSGQPEPTLAAKLLQQLREGLGPKGTRDPAVVDRTLAELSSGIAQIAKEEGLTCPPAALASPNPRPMENRTTLLSGPAVGGPPRSSPVSP